MGALGSPCPFCRRWAVVGKTHVCPGLVSAERVEQRHTDISEEIVRLRWFTRTEVAALLSRLEQEDRIRRRMGWTGDE